jgi:hypothetical protein
MLKVNENKNGRAVVSHHWIRHRTDRVFHAYTTARAGVRSICGEGQPFTSVREVDIPGDRSMCCVNCCLALFGPAAVGRADQV